jgi:dUTP pyrophosphatase
MVVLVNHGKTEFTIQRGTRVAQMLIVPVPRVRWEEVAELPELVRGEGGFGHTGR